MVARHGAGRPAAKASGRRALAESVVCRALEIPREGKIMRNGRARDGAALRLGYGSSRDYRFTHTQKIFKFLLPISYVDIPADTNAR